MISDPSITLSDRVDEIHRLLADNKVPRAIKRSMDFIKEFSSDKEYWNAIIIFSSQFNRINDELVLGVTDYSYADTMRNKILQGILTLLDKVQDAYTTEPC